MELASIIRQYQPALTHKYAARLLPGHLHAMEAMRRCRTPDAGQIRLHCPDCQQHALHNQSCGHRSCPQCQNHETSQWLDRQQAKLLPVEYFMVTFTLPFELRSLAWNHQKILYSLLFDTVSSTLRDFGLNSAQLGAEIGMTAVLHTHARNLDYHPHCHVVVPGGGVDRTRRQWRKRKGRYLFNERALAKVFRGRFLAALNEQGLPIPSGVPIRWVVDCRHVGNGQSALTYLSRYLYRGVIRERNILTDRNGQVTFSYVDGRTGQTRTRTLPGEDFLWLVLQHVLPKGFRRVRDYGFLHSNAKRTLSLVQLVLQVIIAARVLRPRPLFTCRQCKVPMTILGFVRPAWSSG